MSRLVVLFAVVLLVSQLSVSSAWLFSSSGSSGSRGVRNHDITSGGGLTRLYNQRVVHSEAFQRPIVGPINHSGTVVTTEDGGRWLVHKGSGYGGSGGETVVVDAAHMSSRWQPIPGTSHDVRNSRVADYVRAGGRDYSLLCNNCHHGRRRMTNLDK